MTFWIYAIALLALALAMLLIPIIRGSAGSSDNQRASQNIQIAREKKQQLDRQLENAEIDQAEYDAIYVDLQTALALELERSEQSSEQPRGQWMAMLILLLVPMVSVSLYFKYGEYRVIENPEISQIQAQQTANAPQMSLEEMVVKLKSRLRDVPEDPAGWFALGRVMMMQRQFDDAVVAFQRSYDLAGEDAGVMFSLADALAMQNNGSLLGEPEQLIKRGLQLAPNYPNGLWLAGMAAEQRQDYAAAHRYWTQLLPLISDNPQSTGEIRALLAMIEKRAPELATASQDTTETASGNLRQLSLRVDISPQLKQQAKPDDAVFVYAKAMQGPPMPLAVKRIRLRDLPLSLTLSDADAMMPAMKLSSFDQVVVGARVSFSGNPVAQDGDFFTEVDSIDSVNPPPEISLTIDQIK